MQRPRTPLKVSESLHQRLNAYALAASAAGVGVLALAQPAEAKIVYTPVNKNVPNCAGHRTCLQLKLDLNHEKVIDFVLGEYYSTETGELWVRPAKNKPRNQVWGEGLYTDNGWRMSGSYAASALSSGVSVGPNSVKFQSKHSVMAGFERDGCGPGSSGCSFGQWKYVQNKYLGFKFYIKGNVHYGWARLSQKAGKHYMVTTLTGYAYETIPNKPIIAGKTKGPDVITLQDPSLGHLARGASAIPAWRGEQ